jgi:hypothetical protein
MSRRVVGLAAGLLLVVTLPAAAEDTNTVLAPYLRARDEGRTHAVSGEVFAEPRSPTGSPTPYGDVSVLLLPYASDFEAQLDRIRVGLRQSSGAYVEASGRLRVARESYEHELLFAGGGELIRGEVSDAGGHFRFADVPAGSWLILAWREIPYGTSARRIPEREQGAFVGNVDRLGYVAVEYWRQRLEVRPGATITVRLHDRNIWATLVREELRTPDRRSVPGDVGGGSKRRQGTTR